MLKPKLISEVAVLTQAISVRSCANCVRSRASSVEVGRSTAPASFLIAICTTIPSRETSHDSPSRPAQPPGRFRRALQESRDPVHRSAEQNVREKGQDESHDQRLQRIEPAKND